MTRQGQLLYHSPGCKSAHEHYADNHDLWKNGETKMWPRRGERDIEEKGYLVMRHTMPWWHTHGGTIASSWPVGERPREMS